MEAGYLSGHKHAPQTHPSIAKMAQMAIPPPQNHLFEAILPFAELPETLPSSAPPSLDMIWVCYSREAGSPTRF